MEAKTDHAQGNSADLAVGLAAMNINLDASVGHAGVAEEPVTFLTISGEIRNAIYAAALDMQTSLSLAYISEAKKRRDNAIGPYKRRYKDLNIHWAGFMHIAVLCDDVFQYIETFYQGRDPDTMSVHRGNIMVDLATYSTDNIDILPLIKLSIQSSNVNVRFKDWGLFENPFLASLDKLCNERNSESLMFFTICAAKVEMDKYLMQDSIHVKSGFAESWNMSGLSD
ncbi:hypothetical protein BDV95DRAFT_607106 [Massariosphaeria phaeospora]|uniref:Uncharacterized protein n=1 Tax=Massariosphaeria phaeospora TaxID=100035 RepID=A0A7C8I616_9PLEO|nr:hypothetical protein BDV95DRAFT_607106 [Massariosphaeria phaeospora]